MRWTSRFAFTVVASVLSFAAAGQQPPSSPTVTNYQAPGNLESTHALGCISPDQILDTYTPADLYPAVAACIAQNKVENGIYLYTVAGSYNQYDIMRVADESAHDASMPMRLRAFQPIGGQRMKQFAMQYSEYIHDNNNHRALCQRLLRIGPPHYFPRYMTQHGMDAFLKPNAADQLKKIDPAANWHKILSDYAQCGADLSASN